MTEIDEAAAEVGDAAPATEDGALTDVTSGGVSEETAERIAVRASVHLPGLPLGATALVDPSDPEIRAYLESKFLVRVESDDEPGN